MDIKKLKLAIEQAQKVCSEMNQCANKFILQDSINDMNEALTITDVSQQRELLKVYTRWLRENDHLNSAPYPPLVTQYLKSL